MIDERRSKKQEGSVQLSPTLVADTQAPELMNPTDRSLHNPTVPT